MRREILALCMFAGAVAGVAACGGPKAEPKVEGPAEAASAPPPKPRGPKMGVSQELGEIDPKLAEAALKQAQPELARCHKAGLKRVEFMAGDVKLFVRVGEDGKVRWAYFEDSTLGDRATEKCMLDAVSRASWPKPSGGDAEVRKPFGFDAGDAREPTAWSPEKVKDALTKHDAALKACKGGVSGSFKATLYVEPDGKEGKVAAAGVAPPNKDGEARVDCLVDALKGMKLPSPGSYAAKVTFSL